MGTDTTTTEPSTRQPKSSTVEPELLDVAGVAILLGQGESTVRKYERSGRMPAPVRLGRSVRWRRSELLAWIAEGCPARDAWESSRS